MKKSSSDLETFRQEDLEKAAEQKQLRMQLLNVPSGMRPIWSGQQQALNAPDDYPSIG